MGDRAENKMGTLAVVTSRVPLPNVARSISGLIRYSVPMVQTYLSRFKNL